MESERGPYARFGEIGLLRDVAGRMLTASGALSIDFLSQLLQSGCDSHRVRRVASELSQMLREAGKLCCGLLAQRRQ